MADAAGVEPARPCGTHGFQDRPPRQWGLRIHASVVTPVQGCRQLANQPPLKCGVHLAASGEKPNPVNGPRQWHDCAQPARGSNARATAIWFVEVGNGEGVRSERPSAYSRAAGPAISARRIDYRIDSTTGVTARSYIDHYGGRGSWPDARLFRSSYLADGVLKHELRRRSI
jgi:hypothetical protein